MFSHPKRVSSLSRNRHRKVSRRFQVEALEGRALLTLTGLNFGATVASTPVVMNGEMFFVGYDAVHGDQLWESNGTAAGTTRLTDGNDVNGGINPQDLTVVGSTLYFAANDLTHGGQLWKSDGTAAGTTYVTDSNDGVADFGIYPSQLTNANGTLYFTGLDLNDGTQLFKSDGTAAGTAMVKDIPGAAGYAGSYPADLTAAGGLLFFSASDATHGDQLWESNGTASGTTLLTSGNAANGGTSPQFLAAVGGTVYFSGYDPTNHFQLWDSNGTAAGTKRLTSGGATGLGLNPQFVTAAGSTLYFSGTDGTHGMQLWSFTGTSPGSATMLSSGNVAGGGVAPTDLTAVGSTIYFAGNDGVHGTQLWSSTGTPSGTAMVADINGTSTADVTNLINMNGTPYFAAYTTQNGFQVWQSNGTSSGTVMDTDLNTGSSNIPTNFVAMSTTMCFTAPGATMWLWQASKITPTITWAAPAGIVYGTALSATQLDATASVPGTFAYSPTIGTVLKAGKGQTLSVTFTPTDTTDYTGATGSTTINVTQATPTITWASPAGIVYGTALSATQLDATASVPGTFAYSPTIGTVLKAGKGQPLSVTFTPTDTTDYTGATGSTTINVAQATPTIAWPSPASIYHGAALGATQLDATANVPGTFTYSPPAGTVLGEGSGQTLSATFTPSDSTDYSSTSATTTINVLAASASFVKTDTTTQGNWIGVYGSNGAEVIPDTPNLPSYATVSPSGYLTYIATTQTTDVRALQNPGGVGRVSACWFSVTSFTVNVNLNDGQSHVLSLYACDWGYKGRVEQIQISDAATGAVLDTESISSFTGGAYLTWAVGGNVVITVTNLAGPNAIITGIFFDPPGTSQPSSTTDSSTQAGIAAQAKAIGSSSGPAPSGIGTLDFLGDTGPAIPGTTKTVARADSKGVAPLSAVQGRGAAVGLATFSNRSLITGSSSRWSSATTSGLRPGFAPAD